MERLPRNEEFVNRKISSGTHRTDDIIDAVMDFWERTELYRYSPVASLYHEIKELLEYQELIGDIANYCECFDTERYKEKLNEINEKLETIAQEDIYEVNNRVAPFGTSFGMHEGDGSLLGFWEDQESSNTIYLKDQAYIEGYGEIDDQRIQDLLEELYATTSIDIGLYASCTNHGFIGIAADYNPDEVTEEQEQKIDEILNNWKYEIVKD